MAKFRGSSQIPSSGKIEPTIPINADLSAAYQKVDEFISKVGKKQLVQIDADISAAEGRLKRFLGTKGNNIQLNIDINQKLLKNSLSDAKKLIRGAASALSIGDTSRYGKMRDTLASFINGFDNLSVVSDGKIVSGITDILKSVRNFDSITNMSFDVSGLQQAAKITEEIAEAEAKITKERQKRSKVDNLAQETDVLKTTLDRISTIRNAVNRMSRELGKMDDNLGTTEQLDARLKRFDKYAGRLSVFKEELNGLGGDATDTNVSDGINKILTVIDNTLSSIGMRAENAQLKLKTFVSEAFGRLQTLSSDPSSMDDEEKINGIYQERLDIINQIGEKTLKQIDPEKYNEVKKINDSYAKRLEFLREQKVLTKQTDEAELKASKTKLRTQEQINAELDKELQKLKEIEAQDKRNDAAREKLKRAKTDYARVELGVDKAVYDTDKIDNATKALRAFNTELDKATRSQFPERYQQLCDIITQSFTGQYSISNGLVKDLNDFIGQNADIRELSRLAEQGIKGVATKDINHLFRSVVNSLKSDTSTVKQLLHSGDVVGVAVGRDLDNQEIELNQEMQRLYDERIAQEDKIAALKREELDLIIQMGQEEAKNAAQQKQLTSSIEKNTEDRKKETEAIKEATEAKIKYYEIDERAAKLSKQMRSFDDYKEGSATASYRASVDEMAKIVEEKKKQFPDQSDKLDKLFDRYAKNLATFINKDNRIGAQYPSVMISGAGNYNIKKHNKQMASWGKNYQYYDDHVAGLADKIKNLGSSGAEVIRGDEEDALERLEAKLEYMKYWHEIMVEVNKYYRKNKTLDGFEGAEPDELERIKKDFAIVKQFTKHDVPYPSYALSNDSQDIQRTEGRVTELKRLKGNDGLQEENDIYKLWTDKQDMRIRISFEMGKPDQEVIDMLKGKAFKWSPKNNAWQRQLTNNAVYATKQLQKSLYTFYNIEDQAKSATAVIEEQITKTENLAEARLKLTPKKDGSGEYTAMDGKYNISQDAEGWKVFQRDNAGLWNLIGTYKHFEDVKNDVSLLTREEIVRTDEVVQEIKTLQEAYRSLRTETGGYMPVVNKYLEALNKVKDGAMSATDAIGQLNEVAGVKAEPNKLQFADGTLLNDTQVAAVEKYCARLQKSMGETYDEVQALHSALKLVFDISNGNVESLMGRFHNSNPASNAALKALTGMEVNNQQNRDAALRSINPDVYDKIIAEQKAAAEKAKAELASQKTEFQQQWDEFVSAMLGGDAFANESTLDKGKILKAFAEYGDTASNAIHKINKMWLKGELEGKKFKNKWLQSYVANLNSKQEEYDILRSSKAGDIDVDSIHDFSGYGTTTLTEEKAQALRDEAAAWDELIAKKKEYYGLHIDAEFEAFRTQAKPLGEQFAGSEQYVSKYLEIVDQVRTGALNATDAVRELNAFVNDVLAAPKEQTQALEVAEKQKERLQEIYEIAKQHRHRDGRKNHPVGVDGTRQRIEKLKKLIPQLEALLAEVAQMHVSGDSPNFNTSFIAANYLAEASANKKKDLYYYNRILEDTIRLEEFAAKAKEKYGITTRSKKFDSSVMEQFKELTTGVYNGLSVDDALAQLDNIMQASTAVTQAQQKQTEAANNVTKQIEAQAEAEEKVAEAANKTADAKEKQAGEGKKKKTIPEMSIDALTGGIEIEALKKLREASLNKTLFIDLKTVFSKDDLESQIRGMIQDIGEWGDLSLGKIDASSNSDDIVKIDLYNDKMKTSITQTWQLVEATEMMDAHLKLVGEHYSHNVKALDQQSQKIAEFKQKVNDQVKSWTNEGHLGKDNLFERTNEVFDANGKKVSDLKQEILQFQSSLNSVDAGSNLKQLEQEFANISSKAKEATQSYQTYVNTASKNYFQNAYKYDNNGKTYQDQREQDSMRDYYKQQESEAQQFNLNIKSIYSQLMETVTQINSLDVKINALTFKDGGSGFYASTINSLQTQKSALVAEMRSITDEINNSLNVSPRESSLTKFFDVAREKAALTAEEIQKFDDLLRQSEEINFNFGARLSEQIQPVIEKVASLKQMIADGVIDKDTDIAKNILTADSGIASKLSQFKGNPSALAAMDIMKYVDDISTYINTLDKMAQKEQQYFANKTKYSQDISMSNMAQKATEEAKKINDVQQKLQQAAQSFAKESGAGNAFITSFKQSADGISHLDFSVFDTATNSMRNFRMEMGSVTEGMYVTETTVSRSLGNIQTAQKQLQSVGNLIGKLDVSGISVDESTGTTQVQKLLALYKQLSAEIAKGDGANQNLITKLTSDLKLAADETEKFYKQIGKMESAIASGQAKDLGIGDPKGNVYDQLVSKTKELVGAHQNATLEFGRFDATTNTLNASLIHTNGTVETFKVQMNGLNGQMAAQQTGVGKLTSSWDRFKSSISQIGKQLMTALVGYNVFYKAMSEVRKGIGYVKEIDLALTELKKVTDETEESYAQFLNTAAGTASEIGSTVSDFTDATANFARLGYTVEESADMAKTAIVYKNVADGIDTVEESTDSIISTMKAFGIESNNTMQIIDIFNEVGNNFAITSAGIGEAMQRSASALYSAGNSIQESTALITAANSVIQNPEQVGELLADYKVA